MSGTFHVIIPSRFASSRLPGKPLLSLRDKPMVQWVWERAMDSGAESVIIATDDDRIDRIATGFGANCVMTSSDHESGTDRVAEVVRKLGLSKDDIVVNLQGDEPLIPAGLIAELATALQERPSFDISTAVAPIAGLKEFMDPNCVKALRANDGRALYFSRAPVPWPRDSLKDGRPVACDGAWRHIGLYAYRVHSLTRLSGWPPTALERVEKLEQLRALEHGMSIYTLALTEPPPPGIDTPEDLERVRETFLNQAV